MSSTTHKSRVAVVGAGAVGGYFGGILARAGIPVVMIGRPSFVERCSVAVCSSIRIHSRRRFIRRFLRSCPPRQERTLCCSA